jgi:hypothetical protein
MGVGGADADSTESPIWERNDTIQWQNDKIDIIIVNFFILKV